jgi:eukaryotic-like serine/threonine-protein kinase
MNDAAPRVERFQLSKLRATPPGERLDRFELIAELASGGMATVYLGRLGGVAGFQRFVAIKRLHPHLAREPEFVDMFLDEARLAARIHHPNVVPILEIGESDEGYYLVMEYIEGDTAARFLARSAHDGGRLPPPVAMRIVVDALTGLHAAHELRDDERKPLDLVHRDVSPQNILVGVDGVARITDFGVARAATRLSTTKSGQLKGKLAYMAPEQARGIEIDRRADIFAMGAVMWELLAGKRLFKGEGEAETLNRVLFEPIPLLRDSDPSTPPSIEAICMRALQRERAYRFENAAEMADALERTARSLHCLASAREVATYVDSVIGQEISQQRDAVRAWLAGSEPSRNDRVAVPAGPSPAAGTGSHPFLLRPAGPSGPAASSVSSAVIQVAEAGDAVAATALAARANEETLLAPAPRERRSAWFLATPLVLLGLGALGFVYWRSSVPAPVTTAHDVSAAPAPPAQEPAPAAAPSDTGTSLSAQAAPDATPVAPTSSTVASAATAPSVAPPTKVNPTPTVKPVVSHPWRGKPPPAGPSPGGTNEEPDDIAHNPYR